MTYYRIQARLNSPLMVQESRQTSAPRGLPYLPGSSFRGAMAAKYLREGGGVEDHTFRRLFLDRPVVFPNLFPTDKTGETIPSVLPMTGVSCKRFPGFHSNENHGVSDHLALKYLERHAPEQVPEIHCPACEEDMKAFTGFWNNDMDHPVRYQPSMFFSRHTGIDRVTGTVAMEIFYMTQAMADYRPTLTADSEGPGEYCPQFLAGGAFMDEEQFAILAPLLKGSVFAGADRTRGMGELELSVHETACKSWNIVEWSDAFKAKIKDILPSEALIDSIEGLFFSVKLDSHAVLIDPFLRPSFELAPIFREKGFDVEEVVKVAKPQIIRGWNSAWGLPKPDDTGLMMGSVYLFQYKGDDLDGLTQLLNQLMAEGIGLGREQGFGKIQVCDSFHLRGIGEVI